MTVEEKLRLLEDTVEAPPGAMAPDRRLDSLDEWDSLGKLSVLAMFFERFDKELAADVLNSFVTVGDILNLMEA